MNEISSRSYFESAREDRTITKEFTEHDYFLVRRTLALQLLSEVQEYTETVVSDRYTVSVIQGAQLGRIRELLDVIFDC